MKYLACDIVNPNNEKIIKRYLYGVSISQLDKWDIDMTIDDHISYIKKEVHKKISIRKKLKQKIIECKGKLRIFTIDYRDLIKSGIRFEVFHPPGLKNHNDIDPFPTGKDNRGLR